MIKNRYGILKDKVFVIVKGIVFRAQKFECYKGIGWDIYPWCGRQEMLGGKPNIIKDEEVKKAFIEKYGGKFIKHRWYPNKG